MRTYSLEEDVVDEVLKTAGMLGQHNDSAGCESTIPGLMPYKLSHCALLKMQMVTVQKSNLTTLSLSNIYMAEPFYDYWYYTTRQHTKSLFFGEIIFQYL